MTPKTGGTPARIYCNFRILVIIQHAAVGCHLTDLLVKLLICYILNTQQHFPNHLPSFYSALPKLLLTFFYFIFYEGGGYFFL